MVNTVADENQAQHKENDQRANNQTVQVQEESKIAKDFSFKMPTKLLSSTLGKSDTESSKMLSQKFKNFLTDENGLEASMKADDDEYQMQLQSLQDTMKVIREMEEEHINKQSIDLIDQSQQIEVNQLKKSRGQDMRRSRQSKANASYESLDYVLSSDSDGDVKSKVDIREIRKTHVTPRRSEVSEAVTSDLTKVVDKEKGVFEHEMASVGKSLMSQKSQKSQKLDTRSDLSSRKTSQTVKIQEDPHQNSIKKETRQTEEKKEQIIPVEQSLQVDDISFDSTSILSQSYKELDMDQILQHRRDQTKAFKQTFEPRKEAKTKELLESISIHSSIESLVQQKF